MLKELVTSQLKAEIRDKTVLLRALPFVGVVLMLFAFAFDPDRGILQRIAPGLWWVTSLFAAMFVYVRDAHNKRESKFISQFGIEGSVLFIARMIVFSVLTGIVVLVSGICTVFLFSPAVNNIAALIVIGLLTTVAMSTIGAIYAPLVSKLHDTGQLLTVVMIPVLLPALLAATQATEAAVNLSTRQCWQWTLLILLFDILFISMGVLAADSLED